MRAMLAAGEVGSLALPKEAAPNSHIGPSQHRYTVIENAGMIALASKSTVTKPETTTEEEAS